MPDRAFAYAARTCALEAKPVPVSTVYPLIVLGGGGGISYPKPPGCIRIHTAHPLQEATAKAAAAFGRSHGTVLVRGVCLGA